MIRRLGPVIVASVLSAAAVSAHGAVPTAPAGPVDTTPANTVRAAIQVYAVDFDNPAEVASFYGILRSGAQTVCTGPDANSTSSHFSCVDLLVADSVEAIDKPRLTALASQSDPAVQAASRQAVLSPTPYTGK